MVTEPRDEAEIAADYQARHNAAALEAHRRQMAAARSASVSPAVCEECGDDIPRARRKAQPGCVLCVDCQRVHERLGGGL